MADEVNTYANEGGDTEAETAAEIKARNAKLQELNDKTRAASETAAAALEEAHQAHLDAEAEWYGDNQQSGDTPAQAQATKPKAAAKSE